jgi:hypothetical protein
VESRALEQSGRLWRHRRDELPFHLIWMPRNHCLERRRSKGGLSSTLSVRHYDSCNVFFFFSPTRAKKPSTSYICRTHLSRAARDCESWCRGVDKKTITPRDTITISFLWFRLVSGNGDCPYRNKSLTLNWHKIGPRIKHLLQVLTLLSYCSTYFPTLLRSLSKILAKL